MSEAEAETVTRGPGRPKRTEEVKQARRRREGLGSERHLKLHVPADMKDKDFEYRWVNNKPGRVRQLTVQDDWDVVSMDAPDLQTSASEGTVMKRTVDKGTGEEAILVRKRKEFYQADKMEADKLLDARDEAMRSGPPPSPEGLAGSEAYVPGGRNIVAGR
jgi:hypothetical protein